MPSNLGVSTPLLPVVPTIPICYCRLSTSSYSDHYLANERNGQSTKKLPAIRKNKAAANFRVHPTRGPVVLITLWPSD